MYNYYLLLARRRFIPMCWEPRMDTRTSPDALSTATQRQPAILIRWRIERSPSLDFSFSSSVSHGAVSPYPSHTEFGVTCNAVGVKNSPKHTTRNNK